MKRASPVQLRQSLEVANVTDKMREEFEAWAIADAETTGKTLKFERADEWYLGRDHQVMNLGWAAWQASREALVIELPQSLMPVEVDHHSELPLMHAGAVFAAIEAVGLKVKP